MDSYERECRRFAEEYPTANVREAIRQAEAGNVTWHNLYALFCRAMTAAVSTVR